MQCLIPIYIQCDNRRWVITYVRSAMWMWWTLNTYGRCNHSVGVLSTHQLHGKWKVYLKLSRSNGVGLMAMALCYCPNMIYVQIVFFTIVATAPALIAGFMGSTWGLPGADMTQVGPMWATWTLLSGSTRHWYSCWYIPEQSSLSGLISL